MQELTAKSAANGPPKKVFYMKQTISNACGTVALLHSVGNNLDSIKLEDGALKVGFVDYDRNCDLNPVPCLILFI